MPRLRIASYNISGGISEDKRFYSRRGNAQSSQRLKRAQAVMDGVAELMRQEEIDLVACQEVDTCYAGTQTLDQATYLAEKLSAQVASLPLFEYHLGRHTNVRTGLATLSQAPIVSSKAVPFAQRHLPWRRKLKGRILGAKGALHSIHNVEGEHLHIVNAHLTHDVDAQKEFELTTLLRYCQRLDPVVLLGDLNTTPRSTRSQSMVEPQHFATDGCMEVLAAFVRQQPGLVHADERLATFTDTSESIREICTYPASEASIKLDYCIAFSRKKNFRLDAEKVLSSTLSNHAATSALLSW